MQREKLRLLELLKNRGYSKETDIVKIGLTEIIQIGPMTWQQILLLAELQTAVNSGSVLPWLTETVEKEKIGE